MFGIGYQEMFVLLVVALVIFGPGKLPELAGQLGRAVRDFRRMTADLTGEFERTIAEVDDVKQSVRKEVKSMRAEVEGVSKSVKEDLEDLADAKGVSGGSTAKKPATVKGGGGRTGTKPATSKVAESPNPAAEPMPVATKADPLGDVSLLDDEPLVQPIGGPVPATADAGTSGAGTDGKPATVTNGHGPIGKASPSLASGIPNGDGRPSEDRDLAGVTPSAADDALARARRRRAAARYNRRP